MGQQDIPLNKTGIEQAFQARNQLIDLGINTICYSPLIRAKMTAEIINEVLQCNMVPIDELREFNLGLYEGRKKEKWFDDWRNGRPLEGAESYQSFIDRCITGMNRALTHPGLVLIVAHGGVYWAVQEALGQTIEDIPNCEPVSHL